MEVGKSRLHALGMRWLLAAVSTVVGLVLVEGALRVADWPPDDPVWEPCRETAFKFAANLDYRHMSSEYDVAFQTNSLGLRDDEIGHKQDYRILLLGDSFACGYGVRRPELFADLLEKELQVDVVNAGVGGFEIIHQLHYFRSRGRLLKPDLVVYALYLNNDVTGNRYWQATADGGLERSDGAPALETRRSCKLLGLLKRPVALRRLFHLLDCQPATEAKPGGQYLALCADPPGPTAAADYRIAMELLGHLRDEVVASGAQFLVVSFPLRAVVEDPAAEHYRPAASPTQSTVDLLRPCRTIATLLASAGIEHIALTDALRADRQRLGQPLYFLADGHLNATGHRCVAEHLELLLRDRLPRRNSASR